MNVQMKGLTTKYFGEMEFDEGSVVMFPEGLPGFEKERGFLPIRQPASEPIVFLQSVSTQELCFVTMPAGAAYPGYKLAISAEDLDALGLPTDRQPAIGTEVVCLTIISVGEDGSVSANLLAPIVINLHNSRACQPIQLETTYSHRHALGTKSEERVC
jgi:flagellar assembly factor FliW